MKKHIILVIALLASKTSFAVTASQFYVFGKGASHVAFCKGKPPRLFELKKQSGDKIATSEVVIKVAPYDEGWSFMDIDKVELGDEKPPKTCWVIDTSGQEFPILIKGVQAGEVYPHFKTFPENMKPGTKTEITANKTSYKFDFPSFDPVNKDGTVAGMRPKDLTVRTGSWNCTLASVPYLDDKEAVEIVLAADFNKDSLPDFILDASSKFTSYNLNLSREKTRDCESKPTNQELGGC